MRLKLGGAGHHRPYEGQQQGDDGGEDVGVDVVIAPTRGSNPIRNSHGSEVCRVVIAPARTLIREWSSAGQATASAAAVCAAADFGWVGQAAASSRLTRWPRASSLAMRRRVSRSGSMRVVK